MSRPQGRVAYEPSSLAATSPRESPNTGFRSAAVHEGGAATDTKGRIRAESFADHYSQARQFFVSQPTYEQAHIASVLVFELSKVQHLHVKVAMVGHLRHIDESLAQRVSAGLGLASLPVAAKTAHPVQDFKPSPALQTIGKMKPTLNGRTVGILVAQASTAAVVKALTKAATAAGAVVKIVAPKVGGTKLDDGSLLAADGQLAGTPSVIFDAVAIVLSKQGAQSLSSDSAAIDFIRDAFGHLKAIAVDEGGAALMKAAAVTPDAGVFATKDMAQFITAAKTGNGNARSRCELWRERDDQCVAT